MKKYKIERNRGELSEYKVYRRHLFFFWKFVRAYSSRNKALSAVKMFELNDKKK